MMTEQKTLPVHFGDDEAWELTITHEEIPGHVEEGQTLYGDTRPSVRKMRVRATTPYGEEVDPHYLLNSILHEILHATFAVVGMHPHNEEEIVGVLSGPLLRFLGDRRNSEVLQMFAPAPVLQIPEVLWRGPSLPEGWTDLGYISEDGIQLQEVENGEAKWRDPAPRTLEQEADALGKFARFSGRDLTPYIEAVQRMAREAATVDPDTYARLVLSDEEKREAFIGTINSQGEKIEELQNKIREQAAIITAQVETIADQRSLLATERRLSDSSEKEASRLRDVVEKQHGYLRRIQTIANSAGASVGVGMPNIRGVLDEAFPRDDSTCPGCNMGSELASDHLFAAPCSKPSPFE